MSGDRKLTTSRAPNGEGRKEIMALSDWIRRKKAQGTRPEHKPRSSIPNVSSLVKQLSDADKQKLVDEMRMAGTCFYYCSACDCTLCSRTELGKCPECGGTGTLQRRY